MGLFIHVPTIVLSSMNNEGTKSAKSLFAMVLITANQCNKLH